MNDMDYRLLDGAVSDAYACLDRLTSMLDKLAVVRRDAAGWRSAGGAATLDATSDRVARQKRDGAPLSARIFGRGAE